MTNRTQSRLLRSASFAALASAMLLAGCAGSIDDAVILDPATGLPTGAVDTGTFPNLNIRPDRAASQLTDAEKAAKTDELAGAKARTLGQPSQSAAETEASRADLASRRTRSEEVLQEIEGAPATN